MLRLLTLNTHKGFSSLNRRFVLHELREAIRSTAADIVFLQEVVGENAAKAGKHANWPDGPHHAFLADAMWPEYAYGRNAVYPDGHHGNAILSTHPIEHSEKVDISTNRFEQRGFLHCRVALPDCRHFLHCICVHLGLFARSRRKQLAMLARYVSQQTADGAPVVIAGDFNDVSGRNVARFASSLGMKDAAAEAHGRVVATFPAWLPVLALDRVYVRGLEVLQTAAFHRGVWAELSDHAALLVEAAIDSEDCGDP